MYFSRYIDVTANLSRETFERLSASVNIAVQCGAVLPNAFSFDDEEHDLSPYRSSSFVYNFIEDMDAHAVPLSPVDQIREMWDEATYKIVFWRRAEHDISECIPNYEPDVLLLGAGFWMPRGPLDGAVRLHIRKQYLDLPHLLSLREEIMLNKLRHADT